MRIIDTSPPAAARGVRACGRALSESIFALHPLSPPPFRPCPFLPRLTLSPASSLGEEEARNWNTRMKREGGQK